MTLEDRGIVIRQARISKNISIPQMADFLNISENTYKKIEAGEKDPTTKDVEKLIEKLDLDPSLFYSKSVIINGDNSPGVGYGNTVTIDKELLEILKESLKLSNKNSEVINLVVERLSNLEKKLG